MYDNTFILGDRYSRSIANEALAKMMTIEKCDITIKNPLFGSGLPFKPKVMVWNTVHNQRFLSNKT